MPQQGWFRRKVIAPFINSDIPALSVSFATAFLILAIVPSFAKAKYVASYNGIPATTLGLMGFVIAAAAIVVSVQDKGMIRHYKTQNEQVWKATKSIFFATARLLGVVGVSVFIAGQTFLYAHPTIAELIIERVYLGAVATTLIFSVFQINKMIYFLSKLMDAAQDNERAYRIDQQLKEEQEQKER